MYYFTPHCAKKLCNEVRRLRDALERVAFIRYDSYRMTVVAFDALTGGEATAAAIVADALRAGARTWEEWCVNDVVRRMRETPHLAPLEDDRIYWEDARRKHREDDAHR